MDARRVSPRTKGIPPGEAFTPHLFPGLSLNLAALLDEAVKPEE